jgi:hypothetical protein
MNIPYYKQMGIKNINSVATFVNAIPFLIKLLQGSPGKAFCFLVWLKTRLLKARPATHEVDL